MRKFRTRGEEERIKRMIVQEKGRISLFVVYIPLEIFSIESPSSGRLLGGG
jgi:hypothetical protein